MDYSWTCKCCGKNFDTLPMSYATDAPDNWFALTEADRSRRAKLSADVCIIDSREFYVRGTIEVPVADWPQTFVWGVWASVSEESFRRIHELWDAEIEDDEPPRFGWLCTWLQGYPEPHDIKCNVFLRSGNLRPRIVLEPSAYPLAIEQHQGITLERVEEIAAASH